MSERNVRNPGSSSALCTYKDKMENLHSNDLKLKNSHFITIQVVSFCHNRVPRNLKLWRN